MIGSYLMAQHHCDRPEILSAELKGARKEIAELKALLQQVPKRTP